MSLVSRFPSLFSKDKVCKAALTLDVFCILPGGSLVCSGEGSQNDEFLVLDRAALLHLLYGHFDEAGSGRIGEMRAARCGTQVKL